MTRRLRFPALRPLAAAAAMVLSSAMPSLAQSSSSAVGQVSLLIGAADVVHADGAREPLRRGAAILVGDRVETSANGHVHVRFIDNAAVSVRPESVLEVQAYRFDAKNPAVNEVRFNVEHGTARSISGAATEVDKTRFRLNTPIAAIGVRGTDFIVQADAIGVRATVSDGAIVVGALGANCAAAALGPCAGSEARLLTADMGRLMAEVRQTDRVARVVPAAGSILNAGVAVEDRYGTRHAAEMAARAAALMSSDTASANNRTEADLLTLATASLPGVDYNRQPDYNRQLIWGRWAISASADDKVTVPWTLAQYGGPTRELVLGSSDAAAGLYRASQQTPGPLLPDSLNGTVSLNLNQATATFEMPAGRSEAAKVQDGRLTLDFARRTFATALTMSSATGGSTDLRMGGDIRSNGTFNVVDADQRLGGAVSLNGQEAGYWFERNVVGGLFRGKTLWGR